MVNLDVADESVKQQYVREKLRALVVVMGTSVFNCSEAVATRLTNIIEDSQNFDTRTTHLTKLDAMRNEAQLRMMSAYTTNTISVGQGVARKVAVFFGAALTSVYRARWLINKSSFQNYEFSPDREDNVPGTSCKPFIFRFSSNCKMLQ